MKESDKQTSPPRESRTLSRVALGALCLLVLVYFGLQLRDYLVDPFSTAAAAYTKLEETVSANGWLIRAEQVLPGEGSGLLRLTRQEGERVSQGGTVARVYADQASLDRQTELDRLDERIEQLRYAAEESLSGVASLRLDSQIQDSLLALRRSVEGGALAQAESEISQLRSLVLKRDYSRGDGTDAAAELAELQAQRKTLAAQGANSVRTLTAPKSGIYSAVVDGYETVLTPESLDTLTPSALSALTADSAVSSNVGKLITSDRWYYAAALPDDDAADLEEGQSVTLRFSKGAADDLPAEVWRVGESENGRTLVILSGREYLSELTLLTTESPSQYSSEATLRNMPLWRQLLPKKDYLHVDDINSLLIHLEMKRGFAYLTRDMEGLQEETKFRFFDLPWKDACSDLIACYIAGSGNPLSAEFARALQRRFRRA